MSSTSTRDPHSAAGNAPAGSPTRRWGIAKIAGLPHVAILLGASVSMLAWMAPSITQSGKGYVAAPATFTEVAITIGAYLMLGLAAGVGYLVGRILSRRLPTIHADRPVDLRHTGFWSATILFAAIGTLIAGLTIVRAIGPAGCLQALISFNANAFKMALYENYQSGILSLRYLAILAGAIAIFRYLAFRDLSARAVISFGLLLSVAMISSRLSLIWAVVMGGIAYLLYPESSYKRKISRSELIIGASAVIVLLGALTISRTYGYYQNRGADNVVSAVLGEFHRYLAAPFQGGIEAMNFSGGHSHLSESAGIDANLSTNSALMDFAALTGRWNLVALSLVVMISSGACGMLRRYSGTYFIFAFGVLQACHLELWRISMFHRGITLTLIIFAMVVPLLQIYIRIPSLKIPSIRVRL
ncbi:hypothetical protein [Rubripirellula lacrimiformis]|nr:hypothetical protein [Rubripirellula lacrimiformis]